MAFSKEPIITVQELLAFLGDDVTTPEDEHYKVLEEIVKGASEFCEDYIGNPIIIQTFEERLSGDGSDILKLGHYPVVEVVSVIDPEGRDITEFTDFYEDGWIYLFQGTFRPGKQNYKVTYRAGYAEDVASVPFVFKEACKTIAAYRVKREIKEYSQSFGESQFAEQSFPPESAKSALDIFRTRRVSMV